MNKKQVMLLVMAASTAGKIAFSSEHVFAAEHNVHKNNSNIKLAASNIKVRSGKVVNVSTNLRMRKEANTSSTVLGYLTNNQVFTIVGENGEWYKIEHNGVTGYVNKNYAREIEDSMRENPKQSVDKLEGKKGQVINITTSLRIRQQPNTSSSIVGYLTNGQTVNIKNKTGNWYNIEVDGRKGYVYEEYLKEISGSKEIINSGSSVAPSKPSTVVKDNTAKKGKVINVTTALRIREKPNTSSNIIGYLNNGELFEISGKSGDWYHISASGKVGHIHQDYVQEVDGQVSNPSKSQEKTPIKHEESSTSEKNIKNKIGIVSNVTTNLRMRSNANTNCSIIAYLLPNEKVNIISKVGDWYKVSHNGKEGYVYGSYLKVIDGSYNNVTPVNKQEVSSNKTNVTTSNRGTEIDKIINIAKSQLGSLYAFGGEGQYLSNGYRVFDCSGLMQWIFKQVGINIGRTTFEQVNAGEEVSMNSLKPGDLLFYKNLHHVGMYIGNGQWIEAPHEGTKVRISDVDWSKIGCARRVIN